MKHMPAESQPNLTKKIFSTATKYLDLFNCFCSRNKIETLVNAAYKKLYKGRREPGEETMNQRVNPSRTTRSVSSENRIDIVLRSISSYMTAVGNTQIYVERILAPRSNIMELFSEIEKAENQLAKFQNLTADQVKDLKFVPLYLVYLYGKIMWHLCQEGVIFDDEISEKGDMKIKVIHERSPTDNGNIFINIFTVALDIWSIYFNAVLEPGSSFEQTNLVDPAKISFYGKFLGLFMVDELNLPIPDLKSAEQKPNCISLTSSFDAFKFFIVKNPALMTIAMKSEEVGMLVHGNLAFKICSSDHPLPCTLLRLMIRQTLEHVMEVIYQERAYYSGVMKGLEMSNREPNALTMPRAAAYIEEFTGKKKIQLLILRLKGDLGSKEKVLRKKFERVCPCRCLIHIKTSVAASENRVRSASNKRS